MIREILTSGPPQWNAMKLKLRSSLLNYTLVETNVVNQQATSRTTRVRAQYSGDSFLIEEAVSDSHSVSVYGQNNRYAFAIRRENDSPWQIVWQGDRAAGHSPAGSAYDYLTGIMELPYSIAAVPLNSLISDSRFQVDHVSRTGRGDLRIDFTIAAAGDMTDNLQGLSQGRLRLSKINNWAIESYEVSYRNAMKGTVTIVYDANSPSSVRHLEYELITNAARSALFDLTVDRFVRATSSESDFVLSAFGLPEYQRE